MRLQSQEVAKAKISFSFPTSVATLLTAYCIEGFFATFLLRSKHFEDGRRHRGTVIIVNVFHLAQESHCATSTLSIKQTEADHSPSSKS